MNEKVTQMVSLLFKETAPSEEVQRLQEEVLNNCQDRFADLVASGLSEEESLAAVMESLKGMDEVLKEYPRKEEACAGSNPEEQEPEEEETQEKKGPSLFNFSPEGIRAIEGQLSDCDVEIVASDGECSLEKWGDVHMKLDEDGTLRLWQETSSDNLLKGISWENSLDSFEHFGDALNKLGQNLSNFFSKGLNLNFGEEGECKVLLRLPETLHPTIQIRTTSGDISWQELVPGEGFSLQTTSGDVDVRVDPAFLLPHVKVSTTSGDMELALSAEEAQISSVSGDLTWEGEARQVDMNTTSGDVEAVGSFRAVHVNTTSGDLSLELTEAEETEIQVSSVSGDIDLRLPGTVHEIAASMHSIGGDIRCRGVDIVEEAAVRVTANTVSGDLRIH